MKRAHLWPIGITAVLAATVGANLWVMRIASADPSFAIEPNYYTQAVQWDSTLAQEQRNRALGWKIHAAFIRDSSRSVQLVANVLDAAGGEIRDAKVDVTAFAVARSAHRLELPLAPSQRGYTTGVDSRSVLPGRWELHFVVRRGADRLTSTQRLEMDLP